MLLAMVSNIRHLQLHNSLLETKRHRLVIVSFVRPACRSFTVHSEVRQLSAFGNLRRESVEIDPTYLNGKRRGFGSGRQKNF
jgi:hypothetical protein